MDRPKKESVPVSLLMQKDLAARLDKYCKDTMLSKTAAIEKAVLKMLSEEDEAVGK